MNTNTSLKVEFIPVVFNLNTNTLIYKHLNPHIPNASLMVSLFPLGSVFTFIK
jgi:hypothetical protein